MSLRARLLAAFAYGYLLIIVALTVPLALNLARRAGQTGGTVPAVMNAANEVAVSAFLDRRIAFPRIWQVVEEVMNRHASFANPTLDAILEADRWARATAVETLNRQDR